MTLHQKLLDAPALNDYAMWITQRIFFSATVDTEHASQCCMIW
jgi:hypothetical protein